jgi:hypothetical protein
MADEGLEKAQDVSVGRKPVPLIEMSTPTRAVPELKDRTGWAPTFGIGIVWAMSSKIQTRSNGRTNLSEARRNSDTL